MADLPNVGVNKILFPRKIQKTLKSALVLDAIAKTEFPEFVTSGQQVVFPYITESRRKAYTYSSGAGSVDRRTMITDGYFIDQVFQADANYDPLQNKLFQDPAWQDGVATDMGYQLQRGIDQYGMQVGINNAFQTIAAGAISGSTNLLSLLSTIGSRLVEAKAPGANMVGGRYIVMTPYAALQLPLMDSTGFAQADNTLLKGYQGYTGLTAAGLQIFTSNDLPHSVVYTLSTNPTDGQVWNSAVKNVTITFVDALSGADGEVLNGGSAAATQANLELAWQAALDEDLTTSASYAVLGEEDRRTLQNAGFEFTAFATNSTVLTAYGRMDLSASTAGTVGTETYEMISGIKGAIDCTIQAEPMFKELPGDGNNNHSINMIATTQYGAGVYHQMKRGLIKVTASV